MSRISISMAIIASTSVTGVVLQSVPAQAVAVACGTSNTPTVTALADPNFYIDSGISPQLNATYGGYTVRAGTTSEPNLRIVLSNFTGGVVSLASNQPSDVTLPSLTANEATTSYFLFAASGPSTVEQAHTITLYRGATYLCERTFAYARVVETIKALANKVDAVSSSSAATMSIGDALVVTVDGHTGTLGAGPTYDTGVLSYAPTAINGFPVQAWRLEQTTMLISPNGTLPQTLYTDRLYLSGASGPDRPYTAKYTFRAIGYTNSTTTVQPVQYIASGTQIKHTDLTGSVAGSIPPISDTSNLSMVKTVAAVSPSAFVAGTQTLPPSGGAVQGGRVRYTIAITNSGGTTGYLDRIVDTLAAGMTYVSGTAKVAGRTATPAVSGLDLIFYGPISVPAGTTINVVYDIDIQNVAGSYPNSVVGWYGNVKVDGSASVNQNNPATTTVVVAPAYGNVDAINDSTSTSPTTSKLINVIANDTGANLTVTVTRQPNGGTAAVEGTSIRYTPSGTFGGADTFDYQITNGFSSDIATVTVSVPKTAYDEYVTGYPSGSNPATFNIADASGLLANDTCSVATCQVQSVSISLGTFTLKTNASSQKLGGFDYSLAKASIPADGIVTFTYVLVDGAGNTANGSGRLVINDFGPDRGATPYNTKKTINVSLNDSNCGGSCTASFNGVTQTGLDGTVTLVNSNTAVDYTPNLGFVGMDSFIYKKGNSTGTVNVLTAPPKATMTTSINTAKSDTIGTTTYITTYGTPPFAAGYPKYDCTGCVYSVTTPLPTKGSVTFTDTSTGAFTYTPNLGATGEDTFNYTVTDTLGLTISSSVTIQIGPDAVNDTGLTVLMKNTKTFNVLDNDNCPATCTVAVTSGPATGTLTQTGTTGAFSYTNSTAIGYVTFTYKVTSTQTGTLFDTATVTILVEGAVNDSGTTYPGVPITLNILANDPCTDCSLNTVNKPLIGTVSVNTNSTVTYVPPASFSGTATFTYSVIKGSNTTSATVTITVNPDAINDTVAVLPNSTNNPIDVLRNDICADCYISAIGTPTGGTASITADTYGITYNAPASGGPYTFTYEITNSSGSKDTATVTVKIATGPTAVNDAVATYAGIAKLISVRGNDTCTNAPPDCTIEIASDPSHGSVSLSIDPTHDLLYMPSPSFSGIDTFTYSIVTSLGLRATATVTVVVSPSAANDRAITGKNVNKAINVLANDVCVNCTVTIDMATLSGGTIVSNVGGVVTFKSSSAGTFTFNYQVEDPEIKNANVNVTSLSVNSDPSKVTTFAAPSDPATATAMATIVVGDASPDEASTPYQTNVTINLTNNDVCNSSNCSVTSVDLSGDAINDSYAIIDAGAVDTSITYTPATGFSGLVTFTYTATYSGNTATASVSVLVGPAPITKLTDKNVAVTGNVLTGKPCATCVVTLKSFSGVGDIQLDSTGAYTYTPKTDWLGTDSAITYTITDTNSLLSPQKSQDGTITVTVDAITPSVLITKTGSLVIGADNVANIGDYINYSFAVKNTYGSALSNITVTDDKITNDAANIQCPSGGTTNVIASLSSGATVTCVAKYYITQQDIDNGSVTNIGTASGTGYVASMNSNEPAVDTDTATVNLTRIASTSVSKTAGQVIRNASDPTKDKAGDTIKYSYSITNTGNVTLTDVTILDDKIANDSVNIHCPDSGTTNVIATLAPLDNIVCTAVYTLTANDITAGSVTNTATVTATAPAGATDPQPSSSAITVLLNQPISLSVTKSTVGSITDPDANGVDPGDVLTYSFLVKNTSTVATLTNISLTDNKIATGITCTGETGSTISSLAPGATRTCSATYQITQADINSGAVINTATVSSNYNLGGGIISTITAQHTITTALSQNPVITITNTYKTLTNSTVSPNTRTDAGDKANFEYVVTNTGNVTITNMVVSGTATTTVDCGSGATVASLAPGASVTCTAAYTIAQSNLNSGTISNTATATATFTKFGDPSPTDLTKTATASTTLSQSPAIAITNTGAISKGANGQSDAGDNVVFTYDVTNTGNVTLTNISVGSTLSTADCDPGAGTSNTIASLAPGVTTQCTSTHVLTQANINAGTVSDTASASSSFTKSDSTVSTVTASAPATVSIDQLIDATITNTFQSFTDTVVSPNTRTDAGDTASFTYVVTNTGNVTMSSIAVTSTTGTVDCDPGAGTSTSIATLAPGASHTCTVVSVLTLSQVNAGHITDTGQATSSFTYNGAASATTVSPTAQDTGTISSNALLSISTTGTLDTTTPNHPNNTISYVYTVTNTGNITLTNIDVTVDNQAGDAFDNTISSADIDCDGGTTNRISTLAPGASTTCTASYSISQAEIDAGVVRNHVAANGSNSTSATYAYTNTINQSASFDILNTPRALSDNSPTGLGTEDTIIYDLVITNTGNVTLTNISVSMPGLTLTCTPTQPFASLAPGATATCTSSAYNLSSANITAGYVTNTASGNTNFTYYGQGSPTPITDSHPATTYLVAASLTITKSAVTHFGSNTRPDAGDTITYTLSVKNTGGVELSAIEVTDVSINANDISCEGTDAGTHFISLLPAGATKTCTGTYTLSQANLDAGSITNTASAVTGSVSDTDQIITTLTQDPAVMVTNTFSSFTNSVVGDSGQTDAGDTANFTYVVKNTGNVTLTNVAVSGTSTTSVSCGGSSTIATIAPNEEVTCTAGYTITQANITTGSITNVATATDSNVTDTDSATKNIDQVRALAITNTGIINKGANNQSDSGETVVFTYVITNIGNIPLSNIAITSTLGTVDCGSGSTSVATSTALNPIATHPSASETCTSTHALTQSEINAGTITDTGTATTGSTTASDPDTLAIDQVLDASISNSFNSPFINSVVTPNTRTDTGDKATFSYVVTNLGNVTLTSIAVTSSTGTVDCDPGSGTSTSISTLAPGASHTCTATSTLTLAQIDAGSISDTATASTNFTEYGHVSATTITRTDTASATITKSDALTIDATSTITPSNSPNSPNDLINYSYVVTNTGNTTLTDISVTVNNQVGDSFDNTIAAGDINCESSGRNVIATLAPGASATCIATYSISQAQINTGMVRNHVGATSSSGATDSDTVETLINQLAKLSITNTARALVDNAPTGASDTDTVIYDIVVTNSGNVTLTNIDVTIPGLTITCTPSLTFTLAPGEHANCVSSQYTITNSDITAGSVTKTAEATSGFTYYSTSSASSISKTANAVTYLATASLTMTKTATTHFGANGRPDVGDTITYTFSVENTGGIDLTNIDVTDVLFNAADIVCSGYSNNTIGTLSAGSTKTCSATYYITQTNIDAGYIQNTATATSGSVTDSDTITTTLTQVASFTVSKTGTLNNIVVSPSDATDAGDTITYRYVITNTGNITLKGLVVTDDKIADDTTILCPEITGANNRIGQLLPGAANAVTCGVVYEVTAADVTNGSVTNIVSVSAKKPDNSTPVTPVTDTLTIAMLDPNNIPPVEGVDDSMSAPMGSILELDVLKNDKGNDLTLVSASDPNVGTTEVRNNLVLLTPPLMYTGNITFNYVLTDGNSMGTATVRVRMADNAVMPIPEIFLDINANGVRDAKEPGIKGVNMALELQSRATLRLNNGGQGVGVSAAAVRSLSVQPQEVRMTAVAPVASFKCDTVNSGFCSGNKLPLGNYRVKANFDPASFGLTTTADTDGVLDLEAISVLTGNTMSKTQFGVAGLGSVHGRTFVDNDNNNKFTAGKDKVLPLTTLSIVWAGIDGKFGTEDDVTFIEKADINGYYSLQNVPAGSYKVKALNVSANLSEQKTTTLKRKKTSKVNFLIAHPPTLAVTGADASTNFFRALELLFLGYLMVWYSRRRRTS